MAGRKLAASPPERREKSLVQAGEKGGQQLPLSPPAALGPHWSMKLPQNHGLRLVQGQRGQGMKPPAVCTAGNGTAVSSSSFSAFYTLNPLTHATF